MTDQAKAYRSQRNASALVIITWVVASCVIFVTSFVAFLLAPLLLTVVIGGGMWLRESMADRRAGAEPTSTHMPPADAPEADSAPDETFRFGGRNEN